MFIEIKGPRKQCKMCGAIDCTETVIRKHKTFIRCIQCGHEALITDDTPQELIDDVNCQTYTQKDMSEEIEEF